MPVVPIWPLQVGRDRRAVTERAASSSYAWTFWRGLSGVGWGLRRVGGGMVYLFDLVFVSFVGAGAVVGEGLRAGEFVVGGGCGDDKTVAGELAGEAGDGAGYWGFGSIGGRRGWRLGGKEGDLGRFR